MTSSMRVAAATLFLVFPLLAQDQPATPAAQVTLGRIERAATTLRCWPTAHSPVYDESLGEGDVVELTGEEQDGFKAVRLPLGVAGFVHKDFVEIGDAGVVRSKGKRVAFRYRTNSREAPVRFVDEGTEFRLLAEDGDWIRVRLQGQPAWLPGDAVVAFSGNETVDAAWQSLKERQQQAVDAAAQTRQARAAAAGALEESRKKLAALGESMKKEMLRPSAEQDFAALQADLQKVAEGLPADSPERRDAERMVGEIERQVRALEMMRIVNETPRPSPSVESRPAPENDPLAGAEVGWLRVSRPLFGAPTVQIEKGGQVLFELKCTSGRYALDVFENMEVAVRGQQARPGIDSLRTLDVSKLEVLGRARR
ncbi:MAG: hypothetical protein U1F36_06930 [Planctomycetota bacterium]